MTHKEVRKQLRQILVEILPETLTDLQFEMLNKKIDERLNKIEEDTKAVMKEMSQRQKDTLGYVVRNATLGKN